MFDMTASYSGISFADPGDAIDVMRGTLDHVAQQIPVIMQQQLESYLRTTAAILQKRHSDAWPGGTGPDSLSKRSGELAASIPASVRVETVSDGVTGYIGGIGYAALHEGDKDTLTTLTARKGQYLTIPLDAALNSDGTPKKRSARDWGNTFVRKTKKGDLIIFQKRGAQIVPLYLLRKSVSFPHRLGMEDQLNSGIPELFKMLSLEISKEMGI